MVFKKDAKKLQLEYPCQWTYKVVGADKEEIQNAIKPVLSGKKYTVQFSNKSSGGKYCSLNVDVTVESEEDRNSIFSTLKSTSGITMVL